MNINNPLEAFNFIKEKMAKLLEKNNSTNILGSNSMLINLIIFYIVYMLTKDIIKSLITVALYTAVIVFTFNYTYKFIENK